MKIVWNEEKNEWLKQNRNICFEDFVESGKVISIEPHFNQEKYPHQEVIVFLFNDYIHYIPFVKEKDGTFFLKTIIKSRKLNKQYKK